MPIDAASLGRFYQTPLGLELARALERDIAAFAPPSPSAAVMGFGYTAPYLPRFAAKAAQVCAFMPAAIVPGALSAAKAAPPAAMDGRKTADNAGQSAGGAARNAEKLGAERRFPLSDNSIDCILAVHALEFTPDAQAQLAELWRVLAGGGRLILAVPNRRGLWARAEAMPFGQGQPYSRAQLAEALSKTGFAFSEIKETGHFLPHKSHRLSALSRACGFFARHCFPYFGAVLLVEAQKRLYQPIMRQSLKPSPAFMPDFTPAGAARGKLCRRLPQNRSARKSKSHA